MANQQGSDDGVVGLVDAGIPADGGLSSLALLMQLAGNGLAAVAAVGAFLSLFDGGRGETLWLFLILGTSCLRSLMHRAAGTHLLYGSGALDRMAGIRRYIGIALIHTIAVSVLLLTLHAPPKVVAAVAIGLAMWPATLAFLMTTRRFKQFKDVLPFAEDKGFEGASILMTVLGLCGLVAMSSVLIALLDLPGHVLSKGSMMFVVLAAALLVVRSLLHVRAGLSGLRETSIDRSVELANSYANFGVITSFCAGGALLMLVMASRISFPDLLAVFAVCWMLMTWPLAIRRFFSDRHFADLLAGDDAPVHRRAPDAGLTGLGWLLFAHAVFTASFLVIPLIAGGPDETRTARELQSFAMIFAGSGSELRSQWWSVGLVVLQGWAGFELVRMSSNSRVIGTVFGVIGTLVTLYIIWPMMKSFSAMGGIMSTQSFQIASISLSLIIPLATVVLLNRSIAPTARARFTTKPQPPVS